MDHRAGITVQTWGEPPGKDQLTTQPIKTAKPGAGRVMGFQRLRKGRNDRLGP